MNLEPIVEYLSDAGFGEPGQDLYAYQMPAPVSRAAVVLAQMPVRRHPDVDNYFMGEFQVVVRHTNRSAGRKLSDEIAESLEGFNRRLGEMKFLYIRQLHAPHSYPRSEGNELEFSVNYQCAFLTIS